MSCKYLLGNGSPCRCGELAIEDGVVVGHYDCVGPPGTPFVAEAFAEHMAACRAETEDAFLHAITEALRALPDRESRMRTIKTVCRNIFGVEVAIDDEGPVT